MTNRFQRLDLDLKKCYEYDANWELLPPNLLEVSRKSISQSDWNSVSRRFDRIHDQLTKNTISLLQICELFGKGLKQRKTTVLLGILSLIAFTLGHASVQVHGFWSEPIILWMAIVLPTGNFFLSSKQKLKTLSIRQTLSDSKANSAYLSFTLISEL